MGGVPEMDNRATNTDRSYLPERKPRPREIMSYGNDSFKSTAQLAFTTTKNYKGN